MVDTTTIAFEIELPSDLTDFEVDTTLQGNVYTMIFQYNSRGEYYALTVLDADGATLLSGYKVVADWPIASKIPQSRVEFGILQATGTGDTDVPYDSDVFKSGLLSFQFITLEQV